MERKTWVGEKEVVDSLEEAYSNAHCQLSWQRKELPTAGSQVLPAARTSDAVVFLISVNEESLKSVLV